MGEKQLRTSVSLRVTSEGVIVTYSERQQVFGQAVLMREVHHISTFKEAQVEEEGKEQFTIRLLSAQQGLHFSMVDPWPAVKLVNQMLSKWQIQQPVSLPAIVCECCASHSAARPAVSLHLRAPAPAQ